MPAPPSRKMPRRSKWFGPRAAECSPRTGAVRSTSRAVGASGIWSRPEIERALRDIDGPAYIYPHHRYAPWEELARALVKIAPPGLERCFRATRR